MNDKKTKRTNLNFRYSRAKYLHLARFRYELFIVCSSILWQQINFHFVYFTVFDHYVTNILDGIGRKNNTNNFFEMKWICAWNHLLSFGVCITMGASCNCVHFCLCSHRVHSEQEHRISTAVEWNLLDLTLICFYACNGIVSNAW